MVLPSRFVHAIFTLGLKSVWFINAKNVMNEWARHRSFDISADIIYIIIRGADSDVFAVGWWIHTFSYLLRFIVGFSTACNTHFIRVNRKGYRCCWYNCISADIVSLNRLSRLIKNWYQFYSFYGVSFWMNIKNLIICCIQWMKSGISKKESKFVKLSRISLGRNNFQCLKMKYNVKLK